MSRILAQLRKELNEQRPVLLVLPVVCMLLAWITAAALPDYQRSALPPLAAAFGAVVACAILTSDLLAGDRHRGGESFTDRLPGSRRVLPVTKILTLILGLMVPAIASFLAAQMAEATLGSRLLMGSTLDASDTRSIAAVTLGLVGLAGFVVLGTRFTGRTLLGFPLALLVLASCWTPTWIFGQPTDGEIVRACIVAASGGALSWWLAFAGRPGRWRLRRLALVCAVVLAPTAEVTRYWVRANLIDLGDEGVGIQGVTPTADPNTVLIHAHWKPDERDGLTLWWSLDLTTGRRQRIDGPTPGSVLHWLHAWDMASRLGADPSHLKPIASGQRIAWTLQIPNGPRLQVSCEQGRLSVRDPAQPDTTYELSNHWLSGTWLGHGLVLDTPGFPEASREERWYEVYDPFERVHHRLPMWKRRHWIRQGQDIAALPAKPWGRFVFTEDGARTATAETASIATIDQESDKPTQYLDDRGRLLVHEIENRRLVWLDLETGTRELITTEFRDRRSVVPWYSFSGFASNGDQRISCDGRIGWLRGHRLWLTEPEGHLVRLERDHALFLRDDGTLARKALTPLN